MKNIVNGIENSANKLNELTTAEEKISDPEDTFEKIIQKTV